MKIGFITMHRVLNFGSILQAYALQKKIKDIGVDNEIIDFIYPAKEPITVSKILKKCLQKVIDLCFGLPLKRRNRRFEIFFKNNLILTPSSYTKETLSKNPPIFDAYLSGSDQVWNPEFIKNDTTFLLSFAPNDKPRASYSSSFAIKTIPEKYKQLYATELRKFSCISVREKEGISIVKDLIDKEAVLTCDPTMLLDEQEWNLLAEKSEIKIKEKYILVYILSYMYNPYPDIYSLVDKVQKELGNIKVIYLVGKKDDLFRPNSRLIKDAGPCEFINLIKNAEFVITTSFHGTVFSLIYQKPLYAVVKSLNSVDGRIPTLLRKMNSESSLINYDSKVIVDKNSLLNLKVNKQKIQEFREESIEQLQKTLKCVGNK